MINLYVKDLSNDAWQCKVVPNFDFILNNEYAHSPFAMGLYSDDGLYEIACTNIGTYARKL